LIDLLTITFADHQSYASEDYADSHATGSAPDHYVDYGDSQSQRVPIQQLQFPTSQAEPAQGYDSGYQIPQPASAQGYSPYGQQYQAPHTTQTPIYGSQSSSYRPQTQERNVYTKDPNRKHDELDSSTSPWFEFHLKLLTIDRVHGSQVKRI
jgi:hypothetical protein